MTERRVCIYVDADACPVKNEVYRVAQRHQLPVFIVTNSYMTIPRDPLVQRIVVREGLDAADDWIAERAAQGDIVVTADIPLADRCIKAGAQVVAPTGREFTETTMGLALATRNLMVHLRSAGEITSGPKPFAARDRSNFLQALERACARAGRMATMSR